MPHLLGTAGRSSGRGEARVNSEALPADQAEAFAALYAAMATPLWRYLYRTGGDAAAADDLVQESFLRLLRKPALLGDREAARPYLYRIASNLRKDRWRATKRHQRLAPAAQAPGVESHAGRAQLSTDVEAVLDRLSERERALVWLAHVDGYRHEEIAHILGLRPSSIRVLLHRARNKLRRLLEDGGYTHGSRS
ncbi:MAG: RNA polymerase sigma factor [Holophagales bacterium]|nr:RNA polymerase sigma factor [Holophagales bacterium]